MDPHAQIIEVAAKLKLLPELRRRVMALERVYMTNPSLRPEAGRAILHLAEKHKGLILLEYPGLEQSKGEYELGKVHCGNDLYPFGLNRHELLRHMGIYAMTGGGKSVALDAILYHLLKDGLPCVVFDWDGSHKHFLSRPEGHNLNFFSPGSKDFPLPFNPNRVPESFSAQQHLSYLNALYYSMTERHFPNETLNREGVRFLLLKLALHLIQQGEIEFTFSQLRQLAESDQVEFSQREQEWRITLLNFLTRLTTGPFEQVFNSQAHLSPATLLEQQSLIDLSNLIHPIEKADFIESFLFNLYECHLKQSQPIGSPQALRLVVAIEEIHHIGNSVLSVFFREMRKWGAGLIFTAQHPSLVDIQIRGNCFCSISQNLESPEDIETMGGTLLLDRRKLPHLGDELSYLSRIPAGSGLYIIKMQGRFTKAFCISIPRLAEISEEMTDEALKKKMQKYYMNANMNLAALAEKSNLLNLQGQEVRGEEIAKHLSSAAMKLLVDVAQHPSSKLTGRYARLKFNGHHAKTGLIEKGLIEPEVVPNGRAGIVLLRLTQTGREFLASIGQSIEEPIHGDSAEHEWAKSNLAWYLDKVLGWQHVRMEHVIGTDPSKKFIDDFWAPASAANAERVDIHAEKNGKKIAFEIETGKSHYMKNIFKCLKADYDIVVSVATSAEVKAKIRQRVERLAEAGVKIEGKVFVIHQGEAQDFAKGYLDVML
ncbi:ATP-binding protein [Candidatus Acetothermia bacterium]|nr:ATP-binding protein [Candidatus Acetothermia bacterium]